MTGTHQPACRWCNCVLRSTSLLVLSGMKKNCLSSGRSLLLYLYV